LRQLLILLTVLTISISSCSSKDDKSKTKEIKQDTLPTTSPKEPEEEPLPNQRFKKSEVIAPTFDPNLLFGVWTLSADAPACEFEINKKRLLLCDYDGNGERHYKINKDSIFLDNPTLIFKGRILSVSKDSLVIHWQENDKPEILLRWKE
jgi:hypothetical protein